MKRLIVLLCFFKCVVANDPDVTIDETSPATKFTPFEKIMTVTKNSDAYLTCKVENKPPDKDVEWVGIPMQPGAPLISISTGPDSKDPFKYQIDVPSSLQWRLKIQNVQVSDEMKYYCQVSIGVQKYAKDVRTLRVVTAPQIADLETDSDMTVKVGDPVSLKCNATGRPFPIVRWEKLAGGLLPTGGREHRDYVLDLGKAKPEHRGSYKCTAQNEKGKASRIVSVVVQFKPIARAVENPVQQMVGYRKDLMCEFEGYPIPTKEQVRWSKNGNAIAEGGNYETSYIEGASDKVRIKLTIKRVSNADFGYYQCGGSNSEGSGSTQIELQSSTVPTPDSTGQINSAGMLTVSMITIMMLLSVCLLHKF
ncbi:protein amalgam-like [Saccostrea echinata]|uniref:protein amalgam-like n=1 Tax=Saccostrea echinata TaxID=191078 RepID=UPI002A7F7836|nr:protein amalgam-like [Saccostrea echinata]